MASNEKSRHQLHTKLEELLGSESAGTLMEQLPPFNWNEIATKQDLLASEGHLSGRLSSLEGRMDLRFEGVEERMNLRFEAMELKMETLFNQLRVEFKEATISQTRWMMVPMLTVLLGIFLAVLRLG